MVFNWSCLPQIVAHIYNTALVVHLIAKSCFWDIQCCSCSVVIIYGRCNAMSHDKHFVLLSMCVVSSITVNCSSFMRFPGVRF